MLQTQKGQLKLYVNLMYNLIKYILLYYLYVVHYFYFIIRLRVVKLFYKYKSKIKN